MKKSIKVVGAIIFRNNTVLCAQRNHDMNLPLLWEFPGGKIEKGETGKEALERELQEELKCAIQIEKKVTTTTYEYDFAIIELTTYRCKLKDQLPTLTEHKQVKWLDTKDLMQLEWAPADIPAVKIIVNEG